MTWVLLVIYNYEFRHEQSCLVSLKIGIGNEVSNFMKSLTDLV